MDKPATEMSAAERQDAKRYFARMLELATSQARLALQDGKSFGRDEVKNLITRGIKLYGQFAPELMMEEVTDFVLRYSKHAATPTVPEQEAELLLTDCTPLYGDTFAGRFTHLKTSFLHHYPDGREEYFPLMPLLMRCYTVELWRGDNWKFIEITRTFNICEESIGTQTFKSIPPRGDGWNYFDRRKEEWTGWWRFANPEGIA